jgi:hypothetical protein
MRKKIRSPSYYNLMTKKGYEILFKKPLNIRFRYLAQGTKGYTFKKMNLLCLKGMVNSISYTFSFCSAVLMIGLIIRIIMICKLTSGL